METIEKRLKEKNVTRIELRRGMRIVLDHGVVFDVLFPDRDPHGMETNDASVVGRLTYGDTSFLFTGDAPIKIEEYLTMLDVRSLDADVLKVGHHGSKTSTGNRFVGAVSPRYAVISAGKDNSYGHPHQEVLEVLAAHDLEVLVTAQEGTIVFESDGTNLVRK